MIAFGIYGFTRVSGAREDNDAYVSSITPLIIECPFYGLFVHKMDDASIIST